ncbi:Response regulator [Sulfitobacter noctilucicola]|uniref:CheY-like chemotaxis protein n=1 Tax=Sulfitobacter noctilucicola TaxID=1342301 RepID=A0A7W6Q6W6_9RHOB|nr:response regulator [Sulfitobacter noctilucicola]KIN63241.1 Response regulator [Sulfitobacter noctilucicola]MBB4175240.1 CheY-like chemotaxis protein [Sulfitobacter noctilucicola]
MDTTDPFAANIPAPTAARPLLGLTVLVVEDSRFACEALRLLCLKSGARIRRADCLRSARRHFRVYRPSVVVIDLGLPDGNGTDLIEELNEASPRVDGILAISGDPHLEAAAMAAGADSFMEKPITSLGVFQDKILTMLPAERRPKGPRTIDTTTVAPDRLAFQDDMAHIADVLDDHITGHTLDYVAQFLSGVARSADDPALEDAAKALAEKRALGKTAASETARIAGLIQHRLAERIAI